MADWHLDLCHKMVWGGYCDCRPRKRKGRRIVLGVGEFSLPPHASTMVVLYRPFKYCPKPGEKYAMNLHGRSIVGRKVRLIAEVLE